MCEYMYMWVRMKHCWECECQGLIHSLSHTLGVLNTSVAVWVGGTRCNVLGAGGLCLTGVIHHGRQCHKSRLGLKEALLGGPLRRYPHHTLL